MMTQEKNRLKTTDPSLEENVKEHITFLQQKHAIFGLNYADMRV